MIDENRSIFCVPRTGGRPGWDLPTATVGGAREAEAIDALVTNVTGSTQAVELVGAVRNVVPASTEYEWPSPVAYFNVYSPKAQDLPPTIDGVWLTPEQATEELADRHWWPLAALDAEAARAARDDLLITWGYWIDDAERNRQRLIDTAVNALVVGLDSPHLRELAGADRDASWGELDNLILRIVDELGMPQPTEERALRLDLRRRAAQVLAGEIEPIDLAGWGHDKVGYDGPADLRALTRLDAEYSFLEDMFPYSVVENRPEQMARLDAVVRDLAAAVLAGESDLNRFVPERWAPQESSRAKVKPGYDRRWLARLGRRMPARWRS
ncbi:hypothetical protein ACFWQC_02040 [Nocardioides sp. NPDC058538]|uniref:hypothetical protein n=1 Tax=Nocardioides sp. NPDC058538 TaxID=3346542 RepID=UPI0036606C97